MSWAYQPLLESAQLLAAAPPSGTDGYIKWWSGSAWVGKPLKEWNGSSWEIKPVNHWTGSVWQLSNGT